MRFSQPSIKRFVGSSPLPPTIAGSANIKSLNRVQTTKQCLAVVVSWEEPPYVLSTAAKNEFIGRPFNFRVRMLLKSAVMRFLSLLQPQIKSFSNEYNARQKVMYFPSMGKYISHVHRK